MPFVRRGASCARHAQILQADGVLSEAVAFALSISPITSTSSASLLESGMPEDLVTKCTLSLVVPDLLEMYDHLGFESLAQRLRRGASCLPAHRNRFDLLNH